MKEFLESELFEDIRKLIQFVSEKFRNIREPGKPFIIKSFIAIIATLSCLSVAVIILENAEKKPQQMTEASSAGVSEALQETTSVNDAGQLNTNILFGLDNEEGDVHLLFVMSLDSKAETSKIFFLEPTAVCKVNEIEGSLIYHLKNGGVSQLVLAVSEYMDVSIDRYLVGDEKAFTSLIRYMGDIQIDVKESISYNHNGLSYIIDKGSQIMTPDVLLKYLIYLCNDTYKSNSELRGLLAQLAKQLFDCKNSQQAQDNFGSIIGFFETNISALDFSENKNSVIMLAQEITLRLEAYNSLAEFKGNAVEN